MRGDATSRFVGVRAGFGPGSLIASAYFAGLWGIGEALGAWWGLESVKPALWVSEIKPVSREHAANNL